MKQNKRRYLKRIWTQKDGTRTPIRKMTDTHLINSFRMLFRQGKCIYTDNNMELLQQEIYRRRLTKQKNQMTTIYDKIDRENNRGDWLRHFQIMEEMFQGDGYKDFIV